MSHRRTRFLGKIWTNVKGVGSFYLERAIRRFTLKIDTTAKWGERDEEINKEAE